MENGLKAWTAVRLGADRDAERLLDQMSDEERRAVARDARLLAYLADEPDLSPVRRWVRGAAWWRARSYRRGTNQS